MARSLRDTIDALRRSVSAVIDRSALAQADSEHDENRRHGYRIGRTPLLHGVTRDVELCTLLPTYALPNTAPWCLGLVNLRGQLIPVYDLKPLLGDAHPVRTPPRLLISGAGNLAAGIVIDDTPVPITVDRESRVANAGDVPALFRAAMRAAYRISEELWIEPDYDALFNALAAKAVH